MDSQNTDFSSVLALVREYFKIFLIVGVLAAVLGAVLTIPALMPPKFKSVAVVYPINVETYSDESETEQLLQYFEAPSIRDSIVKKFDLYNRYAIDQSEPTAKFYLIGEYNDRVTSSKTLYESVRLEVMDEDPEMAKRIADEVLKQVNLKINSLINQWGASKARSFKEQLAFQAFVIDSIESHISKLSVDNRLLDYGAQSRELVRGYIELSKTNRGEGTKAFNDVESWIESAQKTGSKVKMLQNQSYFASVRHDILAEEYLEWREKATSQIDYLQVVVSPEVPAKKSWPVRWLLVVISVAGALLFTAVLITIVRVFKKG